MMTRFRHSAVLALLTLIPSVCVSLPEPTPRQPHVRPHIDKRSLIDLARAGDLAHVREKLVAGADPNKPADDGTTALIWASWYGYTDVIKALLDAKADVNEKGPRGSTALISAAYGDHAEAAKLLLDCEG